MNNIVEIVDVVQKQYSLAEILEQDSLKLGLELLKAPQADCPVLHKFENGMYIRELHMKAGTLIVGLHHNFDHINNFVKGKVIVFVNGDQLKMTAPKTFIGKAGRKVAYVVEDTIWQNIYITDIQDIALLESMYFTKPEEFLQKQAHEFALQAELTQIDREDYIQALIDLEITQDQVDELCLNEADRIPLPQYDCKVMLGLSPIEGQGIIASANIFAGETIGPARLDNMRTPLGRYTNHAKNPNAQMVNRGSDLYLVAIRDIHGMQGGLQGEEVTTDYRATISTIKNNIED